MNSAIIASYRHIRPKTGYPSVCRSSPLCQAVDVARYSESSLKGRIDKVGAAELQVECFAVDFQASGELAVFCFVLSVEVQRATGNPSSMSGAN